MVAAPMRPGGEGSTDAGSGGGSSPDVIRVWADTITRQHGFVVVPWTEYLEKQKTGVWSGGTINPQRLAGLPVIVPTAGLSEASYDNLSTKDVSLARAIIISQASRGAPGYREASDFDKKLHQSLTSSSNGWLWWVDKATEQYIKENVDWTKAPLSTATPERKMKGLTLEESIGIRQKNAQCLLINNFDTLVAYNGLKKSFPSSNLVMNYTGAPDDLPSKITQPYNARDFVNATTDQLSFLVPRLDFYIRDFDEAGKPKDNQILFSDYSDADRMVKLRDLRDQNSVSEMLKASGFQGTDVGITNFAWKYENKDWGDYVVGASLGLHFGSMADLVNETYLEFIFTSGLRHGTDTIRRAKDGTIQAKAKRQTLLQEEIADLKKNIKQAAQGGAIASLSKTAASANFKQLKVVVGWQKPLGAAIEEEDLMSKNFLRALEETQKTLLLNLVTYDLDFQEQGQVKLNLEYVASIDNFALRDASDVLAGRANIPQGKNPTPRTNPQHTPVPINQSTTEEGFFFDSTVSLKSEVDPGGYIAGRIKRESSSGEVTCAADGVRMELDLLERQIELENLKNPPKKSTIVRSQKLLKLQQYQKKAQKVYEEIQESILTEKYSSFMDTLIYSGKVFSAHSSLIDISTQAKKPKYRHIITAGPPKDERLKELGNRLRSAAQSIKKKGKKETIAEYVERTGALDPLSDVTYEKNTKIVGNERIITVPLYYIRLSDLVEVALMNSNAPIRKDFRVILGSFNTASAAFPGAVTANHPLGDIPISLDYFGQWFFEHIIANETRTLKFRRFMELLCWSLINPLLSNMCDEDNRTSLNIDFTQHTCSPPWRHRLHTITDPTTGPGKEVYDKMHKNMILGDPAMAQTHAASTKIGQIPMSLFGLPTLESIFKKASKNATLENSHIENFFIFYAKNMSKERSGNVKDDSADGIYHLYLGASAGLAKKFNFSTKNLSMIREMNIERANTVMKGASVLILPQDVTIEMVGNTLFQNGSMVYVNAEMGIGTAVADQLQLGGYYRVYRVSNEIAPGRFQTTLDCYFQMPRLHDPKNK